MKNSREMPHKILVVDAEIDTRSLVEVILQRCGYLVIQAGEANKAFEKIKTEAPDLVLLDVMLPGTDGFEFCRRLRAAPETLDLPVIVLTALGDVDSRIKAFLAGADDFLSKPIPPSELIMRIQALLDRVSRR